MNAQKSTHTHRENKGPTAGKEGRGASVPLRIATMAPRRMLPKTTRLLQTCAMCQLGIGILQVLPIPGFGGGWQDNLSGGIAISAGVTGIVSAFALT